MFTDRTTVAGERPCELTLPDGRAYTARLVSARTVLRFIDAMRRSEDALRVALVALQAATIDDARETATDALRAAISAQQAALVALLRAAFPWRRRLAFWRDPVRQILALPVEMQKRVLDALYAVPGRAESDLSDIEKEMRRQRELVRPRAAHAERGPTLALAVLTCEARMGAGWYYDPARWNTVDGYAPHGVVWLTYEGLMALDAQSQLAMTDAIALAFGGEKSASVREQVMARAYPREQRVA